MRTRLTIILAAALLAASCGEDSGVFSRPTTTAAEVTTTATTAASGTTAAPTTTAGTTTSSAPAVLDWAWSRVAAGTVFGGPEDQIVGAVAVGGPGLVAVGSDYTGGDFDAAVWTSMDGLTWSRVPHDEAVFGGPEYQRMWGVASFGPGLVAVGYDASGGDRDAAVWTSTDGLAWSRLPHDEAVFGGPGDQDMDGVTLGVTGLVAYGFEDTGEDLDVAVWTSADGVTWARVPHDEALFGGPDDQEARALVAMSPGFVMAGVDYQTGEGETTVWISPDGASWSRVTGSEAALGGPGDQLANGLAAGPGGLIAVGSEWIADEPDGVVWASPDGRTWSRLPDAAAVFSGPGGQNLRAVVSVGASLVIIGLDSTGGDTDLAVWTSTDGATWTRTAHDEALFGGPGDQWVLQAIAGGPGLVVVGLDDSGADREGLVLVAAPRG